MRHKVIIDCKTVNFVSYLHFVTVRLVPICTRTEVHPCISDYIDQFLHADVFKCKVPELDDYFLTSSGREKKHNNNKTTTTTVHNHSQIKAVDHSKHARESIKTYKLNWKSIKDLWIFKIYFDLVGGSSILCLSQTVHLGEIPWLLNKIQ